MITYKTVIAIGLKSWDIGFEKIYELETCGNDVNWICTYQITHTIESKKKDWKWNTIIQEAFDIFKICLLITGKNDAKITRFVSKFHNSVNIWYTS